MDQFQNLPTPVKWVLGLAGITAVSAGGFAFLGRGFLVFLAVLSALLVLFLAGYFAWKAWVRKKQSAKLGGQLEQHSSAAPRDITDVGKRAKLDELRRKFEEGIREFKARGKDIYKLPWYVFVGPSGSGKTEAIRRSNVGFPSGMQDPLQGAGGTINMHWWFTNHAVILDTAGRLMFEEVKPGETSEWREFLSLLKKNRPNCPINGLVLTIGIDNLIKETADEIQARAGRIAQQLDTIQRTLDVRFPVYVIVTKCDKLTGFREFFNGITDPHLQHQILGWSNPDPLDTPFRPEQVADHLETVLKRLRRRRLALLRDPVPESGGRRTDEVDSLFALPSSFSLIAPRLRRYLETIFVAGEWSAKPLFLRGIYFTSSMREGSALDEELAKAIGLSVDQLPEGAKWDKERAFFLRDLFLEKVFKERGLVTRATNTIKLLRGRQTALYGTGFAALIIFMALFVYGTRTFRSRIGDQTTYWQAAGNGWTTSEGYPSWIPMVTGDKFEVKTNHIPFGGGSRSLPRGRFHADLKDFARKPLELGVFGLLGTVGNLDEKRKEAQRIVFDGSVVRPVVEATRKKLQQAAAADSRAVERQSKALVRLIELERDIAKASKGSLMETQAVVFLGSFLAFLNDEDTARVDANIAQTMAWTYTEGAGRDSWPPAWLSGGKTLAANRSLSLGLDSFLRNVLQVMNANKTNAHVFNELSSNAQAFATAEAPFLAAKTELPSAAQFATLSQKAQALTDSLLRAQQAELVQKPASLRAALQKVDEGSKSMIDKSVDPVSVAVKDGGDLQLFKDIRAKIADVKQKAEQEVKKQITTDTTQLAILDEQYLDDSGAGVPLYAVRMDVYRLAYDRSFLNANLVGEHWKSLLGWQTNATHLRARVAKYQGKYAEHTNSAQRALALAESTACAATREAYVEQVKSRLIPNLGFPLVQDLTPSITPANLNAVKAVLGQVQADLATPFCKDMEATAGPRWTNFTACVAVLSQITTALVGSNTVASEWKLILPKPGPGEPAIPIHFEDLHVSAGEKIRIRNQAADLELARRLRLEQPITFDFYSSSFFGGNKPALSRTFTEWGLLKLLHEHSDATARRNGPTSRNLKVPLQKFQKAVDTVPDDGNIYLILEFNYPLPELPQWPTREQVRNLKAH